MGPGFQREFVGFRRIPSAARDIPSLFANGPVISPQGNFQRIMESIKLAKQRGACLRVGPELEIP